MPICRGNTFCTASFETARPDPTSSTVTTGPPETFKILPSCSLSIPRPVLHSAPLRSSQLPASMRLCIGRAARLAARSLLRPPQLSETASSSVAPAACQAAAGESSYAHSFAQLGGVLGPSHADEEDEMHQQLAASLRQHLEEAFSRCMHAAPGMCAPPSAAASLAASLEAEVVQEEAVVPPPPASLRACTKAVEARLAKPPPAMPVTLEAALQPSTQARMVVEAEAPHKVAWANAAWEELAGVEWTSVLGEPCLEVVQAAASAGEQVVEGLAEALQLRVRGTSTVLYGGTLVRVTAAPLLTRDSSSPRMLLAFNPAAGRTSE